ncbi:MAG: hypothetical protein E3K36_14420 [Candidatus Brocadia sp.]|nr:hypothetical protein [Candidatus Brocadia sp.]
MANEQPTIFMKKFMGKIPHSVISSTNLKFTHSFLCFIGVLFAAVFIIGRLAYGSQPHHTEKPSLFLPGKSFHGKICGSLDRKGESGEKTHTEPDDNQNLPAVARFQDPRAWDRMYCQNTHPGDYDPQTTAYGLQSVATAPIVTTGPASNVTHNSASLQGTVNANGLSTTAWFQYRIVNGPSKSTFATQTIIGTTDTEIGIKIIMLLPGTTYYYRLVAKNDAGTTYGSEMSFTTADINTSVTTEITPPIGAISINSGTHCTNSFTVTANLSATDNTGVTGYYLSTNATPPSQYTHGWISVTPATTYNEDVTYTISNADGMNTVYAWYKDASGNISEAASASIVVDTTPPTITITNPTSDQIYTTKSDVVSISGSASDDIHEISSVVWIHDKETSRTERRTIGWTVPNIVLAKGENVITVKATDHVGNTGTATITITYAEADTIPKVITGHATSITTDLATLSGTVNAVELPATTWFQYGTSSEHYSGTSSIQNIENGLHEVPVSNRISGLQAGTVYYYRLVAQNSAGTTYGNEITFNTLPPKGNIYGNVVSFLKEGPVESAKLQLKGTKARKKSFKVTFSDAHGFFEFKDLDADTYDITVTKTDFKSMSQTVEIEEGEGKKIEIKLKKTKEEDKAQPKDVKNDQQKTNEASQKQD